MTEKFEIYVTKELAAELEIMHKELSKELRDGFNEAIAEGEASSVMTEEFDTKVTITNFSAVIGE